MEYSFLDALLDLIFRRRKPGPLEVRAELQGSQLLLSLLNKGKRKIKFAAVEGRDVGGGRCFPQNDMAVQTVLPTDQPMILRLEVAELKAIHCQRLAVLDTTGKSWPVVDFDADALS